MAQRRENVVTVIVDDFSNPGSHGNQVAGALQAWEAANMQVPFFEVQDQSSSGEVDIATSLKAILGAISAAQQAGKQVVINWSTYGECNENELFQKTGYHCNQADNAFAWQSVEQELLFALARLGPGSWVDKGNVIL
jgi:energy-coupling factor transporter ATP-binding protein EcfA2